MFTSAQSTDRSGASSPVAIVYTTLVNLGTHNFSQPMNTYTHNISQPRRNPQTDLIPSSRVAIVYTTFSQPGGAGTEVLQVQIVNPLIKANLT